MNGLFLFVFVLQFVGVDQGDVVVVVEYQFFFGVVGYVGKVGDYGFVLVNEMVEQVGFVDVGLVYDGDFMYFQMFFYGVGLCGVLCILLRGFFFYGEGRDIDLIFQQILLFFVEE